MTDDELLADLNRLLREGLVSVGWEDVDAPPRFTVTPQGRAYLTDGASFDPVRVRVRIADVDDWAAFHSE